MKFTWSVQWVESHPNDTEYKGDVTLETAISSFREFPWKGQLENAAKRTENGFTSPSPELTYANGKNEKLVVSASGRDGFHVFYETQTHTHTSEIFVSHDFTKNPSGLTVEEIIECFFNNRMDSVSDLLNIPSENINRSTVSIHFFDIHSTAKGKSLPPWLLIGGIFCLCLVLVVHQSVQYGRLLKGVYYIFCFPALIALPVAFLHMQYFFADKKKKIKVDETIQQVAITDKGETVVINKKDILECAVVFNPNGRVWWSDYAYVRIKISETKSFVVTNLLVEPLEIVSLLRVNYKKEQVFFPIILYGTLSEKYMVKRQKNYERKRREFLEEFNTCETEKLQTIIAKADEYADYAVAAAKEILQNRHMK